MRQRLRLAGAIAISLTGVLILTTSVAPRRHERVAYPQSPVNANPVTQVNTGDERRPIPDAPTQPPAGSLPVSSGVQELRASGAAVNLDPDGTIRSVTAAQGKNLGANPDSFLQRFGGALGLTSSHHIRRVATASLPGGDQILRYQQHAGGLPVLGGEIVLTASGSGAVRAAVTDTTPLAPVAGAARISAEDAKAKAIDAAAKAFTVPADVLRAEATLWLYDAGTEQGTGKPELRPTYRVRFFDGDHEIATVLIDGLDGHTVLTASDQRSGGNRVVCDLNNTQVDLNKLESYACNPFSPLGRQPTTRQEGGPVSSVSQVNVAYQRLGNAADYFRTNFGRDSYDGRGGEIRATVRACHIGDCKFENAFWDGYQFVFGDGWATDDVAAHEYAHAVTENASSLLYWYQSGAINEALSDIFGEFIDLSIHDDGTDDTAKRWQVAENIPVGTYFTRGGPIRHMAQPSLYSQPESVYGAGWAYTQSDNGGVHTNSGPANKAAALIADGGPSSPGIGLVKSGHLWYRVMHVLPSGAGYSTLLRTLMSSCLSLVGHYGFTTQDCQVSVAAGLVPLQNSDPYAAGACPGGYSPDVFWRDDMERDSGSWRFSGDYHWLRLPAPLVPFTYAFSGRGSMNGWNPTGGSGNGTYIEMINPVALSIPYPKIAFAYSMINRGNVAIRMQINDGAGWVPLMVNSGWGDRIVTPTGGYTTLTGDLSSYYGKSVRLRFVLEAPTGGYIDWYMDDISLYSCDRYRPSPIQDAYGYHTTGGMQLNWTVNAYSVPASWDLAYTPAIPGAPASVPFESVRPVSLLVPGADPGTTYRVRVTPRSGEVLGDPVEVLVSPRAPAVCPSNAAPIYLSFIGWRPAPPLPEGQCTRPLSPQR